ncbi:MAG: tRNA dihydrouridine synthase DusB, partial [Polyangiaceae bacterium]
SWFGERMAVRSFRKHTTWYTKGFRGSAALRGSFMKIESIDDLRRIASSVDPEQAFPPSAMRVPRGKSSGTQQVALPDGYLDNLEDDTPPGADAEDATSGG